MPGRVLCAEFTTRLGTKIIVNECYVRNHRMAMYFPMGVQEASSLLEKTRQSVDSVVIKSIADRGLVTRLVLVRRLLPVHLSVRRLGGVDGESSFCGASFSVGTTSDNLAVRVLRDPLAGRPGSSIVMG